MSAHPFDPVAVGDQIAAYEAEASKARDTLLDCTKKSGALLLDVQQNHPEHLEAICAHVGLSRSRRCELLSIAGGRRSEEENRRISNERQKWKREKDKAAKSKSLPPPKSEPPESVTPVVTDSPEPTDAPPPQPVTVATDPEPTDEVQASADRRKAEYEAMEAAEPGSSVGAKPAQVERAEPAIVPEPIALPKVKVIPSDRALLEFKIAVDIWFPKMNETDREKALGYVKRFPRRVDGRAA
jgi:hypothetical protein